MPRNIDGINKDKKTKKRTPKKRVTKKVEEKEKPETLKEEEPHFIPTKRKSERKFRPIYVWLPIVILIAIGLGYLILTKFDHAVVEIKPRVEEVTLGSDVTAFRNPQINQFGFDVIAASHTASMEISATGSEEIGTKASGEIVIYNKFSKEAQRLSPETRFETPDGKIFKLGDEGIIIPGMKSENEPGSVEATIHAEFAGPEYNIDLTDFTIPGFEEIGATDRFNNIYALSKTHMSGGSIKNVPVVSESDRLIAEKELQNRLRSRLSQTIERQKAEDFIVVSDSIRFQFQESTIEEIGGSTIISQKGIGSAILVSKGNLTKYLKQNIYDEEFGDGIEILSANDLDINVLQPYDIESSANSDQISISLSGDIVVGWNIDTDMLRLNILGLSKDDAIEYIGENPGVDTAVVRIYPFWDNTIPIEKPKLDIKVEDFHKTID